MAKANIIKVEALEGRYVVEYETGSVRYYGADKAPKTVRAWIEAHVEEPEITEEPLTEDAPVDEEVTRVEQVVEQVVEQAPKTPRPRIINDSDIAILSYFWDLESLFLILIRAGLIGTVWILEGTVKALPVIRVVIKETVAVIQEITGWIFEGADLIREATVYVVTVL